MKQFFEKLKDGLTLLLLKVLKAILTVLVKIKNLIFAVLFHRIVIAAASLLAGFHVGARLHEVGMLEGHFGKDLSGATVFVSGACKSNGVPRLPALAEDQLIVTGQSEKGDLIGILRKTRESIICERSSTFTVSKLSPWKKLGESLISVPELQSPIFVEQKEPDWKKLAQKTLVMSGTCVSVDGKMLPPFTDEKVDVTNVDVAKDNPNAFIISGIKKSDKYSISCVSTAVKYSIYQDPSAEEIEKARLAAEAANKKTEIKSYIGETILVTGTCFPDSRLPKHKVSQKVAFYPLLNNPIQVVEEKLDTNGKLKWLSGFSVKHGVQIVCDHEKFAISYKDYDSDGQKLEQVKATEQGAMSEDLASEKRINDDSAKGAEN